MEPESGGWAWLLIDVLFVAILGAMLKVSERTLFRELRAARDREEVGV
jgi:hypothetical protein